MFLDVVFRTQHIIVRESPVELAASIQNLTGDSRGAETRTVHAVPLNLSATSSQLLPTTSCHASKIQASKSPPVSICTV
eukprot:scaffold398674_cov38-Prasinocladus_malaysianus.AAC.3